MADWFLLFDCNFLTNVIFLGYREELWHMRHNDRNTGLKSVLCDDSSFFTMKNTSLQPADSGYSLRRRNIIACGDSGYSRQILLNSSISTAWTVTQKATFTFIIITVQEQILDSGDGLLLWTGAWLELSLLFIPLLMLLITSSGTNKWINELDWYKEVRAKQINWNFIT